MARWRLKAKHYINATRYGEKTQWVKEETNRDTGRTARHVYDVPMYLDPDSPQDQNYPGEVIVARPKGANQKDILVAEDFIPTPDMDPIDEEAERISAQMLKDLPHPIDSFPAMGGFESYSDKILQKLSQQLEEAFKLNPPNPPTVQMTTAQADAMKKMQDDIRALMDANAKLQAQLQARPK